MTAANGNNQALQSLASSLSDSKRTSDATRTPARNSSTSSKANTPRIDRIKRKEQRELTPEETDEMDRFFIRMQAIYRHLWSSSFDGEAMIRQAQKEWLDTFYRANLTGKQINEGIIRCKQTFERPPSPKEFLALLPHRRQENRKRQRALPEPEADRKARYERGAQKMRELKAMLKKTKPTGEDDHE